jgi:hypothetical protein
MEDIADEISENKSFDSSYGTGRKRSQYAGRGDSS